MGQEHGLRQLAAEADGAADDAAQYVAAPFVRRDDAVADEERGGAGVVAEDAHGRVELVVHSPAIPVSADQHNG